jgi:PKD repeat protein
MRPLVRNIPPLSGRHPPRVVFRSIPTLGVGLIVALLLLSTYVAQTGPHGGAFPQRSAISGSGDLRDPTVATKTYPAASTRLVRAAVGALGWSNLTHGPTPSARVEFGMAYDAADNYVLLFGGRLAGSGLPPFVALNDTWTYRAGVWKNITSTAGPAPPAREAPVMVYDATDGYVLLAGGTNFSVRNNTFRDVWSFSGGHWTERSSNALQGLVGSGCPLQGMYDSTDQDVVVLGCDLNRTALATFTYHAGTWTNVFGNRTTNTTIPVTCDGADNLLVDEPALSGVVLFGGLNGTTRLGTSAACLFSAGHWSNESPNLTGTPPGRFGGAGDYDLAFPGFVLFGGYVGESPLTATNVTWVLENTTWTNETSSPAPNATRTGGSMVWDAADNASIWFGGNRNETWSWGTTVPLLNATIRATPTPADSGVPVHFSASQIGGTPPFVDNWSFGDGTTSSSPSPSHAYDSAGTYQVNLTVHDALSESTTTSLAIPIAPALAASVRAHRNPVDAGVPVQFTSTISGGFGNVSYAWNFGDGPTSNSSLADPTHGYASSGNFSVLLTATDDAGGSVQVRTQVQVVGGLTPPTIVANPSSPELGQLVNFTAIESAGQAPYQYSWAFGDGGTGGNLSSISHIFTTNGPFVTSVTVVDADGAQATGTINLTIALNVTILGNWSAGAAPLVVGFVSTVVGGVPGYQYTWTFGDGATSTAASPAHEFTAPGFYTASVRVEDREGASVDAGWQVYVAPSTGGALSVSLSGQPSSIAPGQSSLVTASIGGGVGGYSLDWIDGGANCAPAGLLSVRCAPAALGSYTVELEVHDQTGHAASGSVEVVVGGPSRGASTPPALTLTPIQIGLVIAVLGVTALLVVVVTRRPKTPRSGAGEPGKDAFAAYRSPSPGGPPTSVPSTGPEPSERRRAGPSSESDPLSDLE